MNNKYQGSEERQGYNYFKLAASCFLFLVILLCLTACSLDRKNPLDPKNNPKITVPNQVVGIKLETSARLAATKWVKIEWQKDTSVHGYYVYRGLSINSQFMRIADIDRNDIVEYIDRDDITPGVYWYRLSAYKDYPEGRLEGKLSPLTESSAIEVRE